MHNSRHVCILPADDDMSSSLRCVRTALPASTIGRWTEGLSLCHWHSCHLTQVLWRTRCRIGKSSQNGRVFEQIDCHSLRCMRLGLIRHFYLCLENWLNHLDRWFPLNVTWITWPSFICWFATTSSVQISWSPFWTPSIQWHLIWQIWFNKCSISQQLKYTWNL